MRQWRFEPPRSVDGRAYATVREARFPFTLMLSEPASPNPAP
jgi:hypothetical protein